MSPGFWLFVGVCTTKEENMQQTMWESALEAERLEQQLQDLTWAHATCCIIAWLQLAQRLHATAQQERPAPPDIFFATTSARKHDSEPCGVLCMEEGSVNATRVVASSRPRRAGGGTTTSVLHCNGSRSQPEIQCRFLRFACVASHGLLGNHTCAA